MCVCVFSKDDEVLCLLYVWFYIFCLVLFSLFVSLFCCYFCVVFVFLLFFSFVCKSFIYLFFFLFSFIFYLCFSTFRIMPGFIAMRTPFCIEIFPSVYCNPPQKKKFYKWFLVYSNLGMINKITDYFDLKVGYSLSSLYQDLYQFKSKLFQTKPLPGCPFSL